MNHVCKGISILFTFANHSWDVIPWVAIIFHSFDDFNDGVNIGNVLLDVLSFEFVDILLLLEFSDSLVLILLDLVVLFPCNSFDVFLLLVVILFIIGEILTHRLIEGGELFTGVVWVLAVSVGREFEVVELLLFIFGLDWLLIKQVSFVLGLEVSFEEV